MKHLAAILIVFGTGVCLAQTEPAVPKFPSDGEDPAKVGGARMLESVCPGRVVAAETIGCRGCFFETPPWSSQDVSMYLERVTRGHFLSSTSDDAVLWMEGCVMASRTGGRTYLLSRKSGRWTVADQDDGSTSTCHKVRRADGREVLVCLLLYDWYNGTDYYVNYRDYQMTDEQELYAVTDGSKNCGLLTADPSKPADESKPILIGQTFISGVEVQTRRGQPVSMSVIVNSGQALMRPGECPPDGIPTRPSRVQFSWTGTAFQRVTAP
jgi:hypothetical protein